MRNFFTFFVAILLFMPVVAYGVCPVGQYENGGCQPCPANFYCPGDNEKYECPTGTTSPGGTSICTCQVNKYWELVNCPTTGFTTVIEHYMISADSACPSGYSPVGQATDCPTVIPESSCTAISRCLDCASGLFSPAGSDEAADCGHILHFGNNQVYLRSARKTSPSFYVSVGGTEFYGNLKCFGTPPTFTGGDAGRPHLWTSNPNNNTQMCLIFDDSTQFQ